MSSKGLLLALTELGGAGPAVLLLHANGFHAHAYRALAKSLICQHRCIGIDLPGHGLSHSVLLEPFSVADALDLLVRTIRELRISPCYVVGHSLGGALAVLAEAQHPGLFRAIYCFEPVVTVAGGPGSRSIGNIRTSPAQQATADHTASAPHAQRTSPGPPATSTSSRPLDPPSQPVQLATGQHHQASSSQHPPHSATSASPHQPPQASQPSASPQQSSQQDQQQQQWRNPLARLASKRRSTFPSKADALASLGSKPPFSMLHPTCLQDYIEHGLQPQVDSSGHHKGYQLVCRPLTEASVFEAFNPLPVPDFSRVRCPVRVASGEGLPGMHQLLYKAAAAAAQGLPFGEHKVFEGLAHLGPLEDPARVADDALDFFVRCQQGSAGQGAARKLISKL